MKKAEIEKTENAEATPLAVAPVAHPFRTRFVALILVLALLVAGAATLIVFTFVDFSEKKNNGTTTNQTAGYPYRETTISDYIALTPSMVTGLVIPGAESKLSDVTDESIKTLINQQLLSAVATSAENKTAGVYTVKKTLPIGYADEVQIHLLYVTNAAGERVGEDVFPTAYMSSGFLQVGMEFFGKEFDDKLIGLVPKDTGSYEVRTYGSVDEDDVICLTYTVTEKIPAATADGKETTKTHVSLTGERIELARKDKAWRDLLLEKYGTVGQSFSFDYKEDIDDDGDEETVTYSGVVSSVVTEETPYALTAKLPEDFFAEGYEDEELVALNGEELTFYINVDFMIDHEANTWETMTIADMVNTLKVTLTNKEDLAAARAECLATVKKQTKESNDANESSVVLGLIWAHLIENLKFTGKLPEEAMDEAIAAAKAQVESAYSGLYSSDELFAKTFPNIDLYAASAYMWNYDATEYDGYEDYIERYYAPRFVKQSLLVFGIYHTCINDEKKLDAAFEEYINEGIAYYASQGKTITREELLELNDEDTLRDTVILELVNEYLAKNNTIDWNAYKNPK